MTFKKNDRVEFDGEDGVVVGTVTKGGKKLTVVQDGGEWSYSVHESHLRSTSVELPKEPDHAMNRWSISKTAEIPTEIRKKWSKDHTYVSRDGEAVIAFLPDYTGGGLEVKNLPGEDGVIAEFYADLKSWLEDLGYERPMFGIDQTWLTWKTEKQPFGITGQTYIDAENAQWSEFTAKHGKPGM